MATDFQEVLRNLEESFFQTLSNALATKGVVFTPDEMRETVKKQRVPMPPAATAVTTTTVPTATRTPSPKQKCGYLGVKGGTCKKAARSNCYTCETHQSQESEARGRAGASQSVVSMPPVRAPMQLPMMPTPSLPKWTAAEEGWMISSDDASYRLHKESGLIYHEVNGTMMASGMLIDGKIQPLNPAIISQLKSAGQMVEGVSA